MRTSLVTLALLVASSSAARLGSDRHVKGLARRHTVKRNQANKAAVEGANAEQLPQADQEEGAQAGDEQQIVTTTDASGAQCTIAAADLAGALELANAGAAAPTAPPQAGKANLAAQSSSASESTSAVPTAAPPAGARRMIRRNKQAPQAEADAAAGEQGKALAAQKQQAAAAAKAGGAPKAGEAGKAEADLARKEEANAAQEGDAAAADAAAELPACGPLAAEDAAANADLNADAADLAAEVCPPPVTVTVSADAAEQTAPPALDAGKEQGKPGKAQQNNAGKQQKGRKGGKGQGQGRGRGKEASKQQRKGDNKANKHDAEENGQQLLALIQALQAQHAGGPAAAGPARGKGHDRRQLGEAAAANLWEQSKAANAGNDRRQLPEGQAAALWAESKAANAGNDRRR